MDAFESLVAMLLRHQGYWTLQSYKVPLGDDRERLGIPTAARWELDVVAYTAKTNTVLVVECKSFLDSRGVAFRNEKFGNENRYKLFTKPELRHAVLTCLESQLLAEGRCLPSPSIQLCLAAGKIAGKCRDGLKKHFDENGWLLFDAAWVRDGLRKAGEKGYENDIAFLVAKFLKPGIQ